MPRRELDAGNAKRIGHQIDKGVVRLGQVQVHRVHYLLGRMRPGDRQHFGVHLPHQVTAIACFFGPQAARDDDPAVFRQSLTDGVKAFLHRFVNKAAGVHNDEVCARKGLGGLVTLGAELGQDQL